MMGIALTDLPLPDSPTSATVLFLGILRDSFHRFKNFLLVDTEIDAQILNFQRKSCIHLVRGFMLFYPYLFELRIERIAQGIGK